MCFDPPAGGKDLGCPPFKLLLFFSLKPKILKKPVLNEKDLLRTSVPLVLILVLTGGVRSGCSGRVRCPFFTARSNPYFQVGWTVVAPLSPKNPIHKHPASWAPPSPGSQRNIPISIRQVLGATINKSVAGAESKKLHIFGFSLSTKVSKVSAYSPSLTS